MSDLATIGWDAGPVASAGWPSTALGRLSAAWQGWRDRRSVRRSDGTVSRSDAAADLDGARTASPTRDADAAFHQLVLPQLDAAYNFARFLSRDPDGAQDIVQEAAIRAYRGFAGFRGGDARAWLLAIVRNCHRDWAAARRRAGQVEVALDRPPSAEDSDDRDVLDTIASEEETPEQALLSKTEAARVRTVLASLPETSREILVLRELEQLSYREIAEVAHVPIGTVMSRLARARRAFASAWTASAWAEPEGGR